MIHCEGEKKVTQDGVKKLTQEDKSSTGGVQDR